QGVALLLDGRAAQRDQRLGHSGALFRAHGLGAEHEPTVGVHACHRSRVSAWRPGVGTALYPFPPGRARRLPWERRNLTRRGRVKNPAVAEAATVADWKGRSMESRTGPERPGSGRAAGPAALTR